METSNRIDVARIINDARISLFQWRTFVLLGIVNMLDGYDTQTIAFVAPDIAHAWKLGPTSFGPIFSAGLLGSVIGAVLLGMLADRIGRRVLVISSVAMFGVLTWVCAAATTYNELLLMRLLAGIGLGGALVNFLALGSEYAPARVRMTVITVSMWGFPMGAVIGGAFAGRMIEHYGWPSVFHIGGILPLLCVPLLAALLPESVRYMTLSGGHRDKMASILSRIDPARVFGPSDTFFVAEPQVSRGSAAALFRNGLGIGTVLLWLTLFSSLVLTYCLINWIPLLLRQVGLSREHAVLGTVVLNFAGIVGSLLISRIMARHPLRKLAASYVLGAFAVAATGLAGRSFYPIMTCIFLSGFFVIGAQLAVTAYIADYYPTAIRGTGVGYSQGVGRFGSLVGPLAGGVVLSITAQPSQMFLFCAIPALAAALALLFLAHATALSANAALSGLQASPYHRHR
ncbi:MFS transporter [Paraburkholderia sediminicola]|uniref:MFS transporter n=1 Tax=Paraburkholderia sediminicola TaxID=458836 RepID=UPI0038B9F020